MRRIVIGYDGSDRGRDAVALGRAVTELAAADGADDVRVALVYPPVPGAGTEEEEARRRQAQRLVAGARTAWPELPADAVELVHGSSPAAGLHGLALERRADAIVVGASHRGPAGRVVPGSATEQTLHGAPCAVLVAPPGYAEQPSRLLRRIGVAYDGASEARSALALARQLARGREDVTLVVLAVADTTQPFAIPAGHPSDGGAVEAQADRRLEEANRELAGVAQVALVRRAGDPIRELLDAATELDLLVLGSRGHGPLRRLLLGSVSTHVVRAAACPLLLLPRGAAASGGDAERGSDAAARTGP